MSEIRQYVLDIEGLEETVLTDRQTDRQTGTVITKDRYEPKNFKIGG